MKLLVALIGTGLLGTPAWGDVLLHGTKTVCRDKMSCVMSGPQRSEVGETVRQTPIPAADVSSKNACDGEAWNFAPVADKIPGCEAWIASNFGTPRERARAIYNLGHSYTFSKLEMSGSIPVGWRMAVEAWSEAIDIDPSFAEPYFSKGLYLATGETPLDALETANLLEERFPEDWRGPWLKAKAYNAANRRPEALEQALRATELDQENPLAAQMVGVTYSSMWKSDDAIAWLRRSIVLEERHGPVAIAGMMQETNPRSLLTMALVDAQRWAEAELAVSDLIRRDKANSPLPHILIQRAGIREQLRRFGDAADDIAAALKSAGGLIDVGTMRFRRARLLAMAGRADEAEAEFSGQLRKATLRQILQVQVMLKNAGFTEIVINGQLDDALRTLLRACLREPTCLELTGKYVSSRT
jgi:tetratricopeptide (TPR) repeat protein